MPHTDVLIIGSGIAGLSVAIKIAQRFPNRQCLIITKQESVESNTRYAQGGIAVVSDFNHDSFESHIADTLQAGDGLCDPEVVTQVVREAPARLEELMDMGADFDRDASGELSLGREGGHTANRIIHFQDVTGLNISMALLERVKRLSNVTLLSHHVALDLITEESISEDIRQTSCRGVFVLDLGTNSVERYHAAVTVLATGGLGQLYQSTTNPLIATGDGIAMAYRAGAAVSHMEFIQFHPTALYDLDASPAFLISEAVRGEGAYLRNSAGERFMFKYHIDGEMACRDVVSRAIASEILTSKEKWVYLDCTHLEADALMNHFPNIYQKCLSKGFDITKDYIPVAPAAHYLCGGIDVDLRSRTTLKNLYACGECSNTGLHGANRLASNSLLEATVFAHNCFKDIEKAFADTPILPSPSEVGLPIATAYSTVTGLDDVKRTVQFLMTSFAGIVRTTKGLQGAYQELQLLEQRISGQEKVFFLSADWYEVRNMIICAQLVVKQSLERRENRGGFFNKNLAMGGVFS